MISLWGNISILSSILFFLLSVFMKSKYLNFKKMFFAFGGALSLLSFVILLYGFIVGDFSLKTVFFNSDKNKELFFKIAASWGNNDGSLLFWNSLSSLVFLISLFVIGNFSRYQTIIFINVSSCIVILYGIFALFYANPFDKFKIIPTDGVGLNPILQDKALMIHPPILYLGSIFSFIPFIISVMMILDHHNIKKLVFEKKKFTAIAILLLSIGISLGSWWAYRELGWGDFWFFDPVENLSLIPWIMLIALYHNIVLSQYNPKYHYYSVIIAFAIFITILYSISIVRSGIISSVHSFAFSQKALFLFLIAFCIQLISCIFLYIKKNNLSFVLTHQTKTFPNPNNAKYIKIGNILFLFAAFILIFAILTQLFALVFFKQKIAINEKFFIKTFIPIFVIISLIMSCVHLKKYRSNKILTLVLSILIVVILRYTKHDMSVIATLSILASIILIIAISLDLLIHKNFSFIILGSNNVSMHVGHLGFGILILSIALNCAFSQELFFEGKIGDLQQINKIEAKLLNIKIQDGKGYFKKIAEFLITTENFLHKKSLLLKPEQRFYKTEKQISSEVDIYSYLLEDIYCVITSSTENQIKAKIFYRPFMSFIWLSCFLISTSFALSFTACRK